MLNSFSWSEDTLLGDSSIRDAAEVVFGKAMRTSTMAMEKRRATRNATTGKVPNVSISTSNAFSACFDHVQLTRSRHSFCRQDGVRAATDGTVQGAAEREVLWAQTAASVEENVRETYGIVLPAARVVHALGLG